MAVVSREEDLAVPGNGKGCCRCTLPASCGSAGGRCSQRPLTWCRRPELLECSQREAEKAANEIMLMKKWHYQLVSQLHQAVIYIAGACFHDRKTPSNSCRQHV